MPPESYRGLAAHFRRLLFITIAILCQPKLMPKRMAIVNQKLLVGLNRSPRDEKQPWDEICPSPNDHYDNIVPFVAWLTLVTVVSASNNINICNA